MAQNKFYAYVNFDWLSGNKKEYGILKTWDECKEKTHKVKGSRYKSFMTIEEATEWIEDPIIKSRANKYYAVYSQVVEENKVFQDYPRLKALIENHKENNIKIKYKGFENKEEAEIWLKKVEAL